MKQATSKEGTNKNEVQIVLIILHQTVPRFAYMIPKHNDPRYNIASVVKNPYMSSSLNNGPFIPPAKQAIGTIINILMSVESNRLFRFMTDRF